MTRKKERQSLTLELEIDGEIKRFVTPQRIPGVLLREAGLIADEFETGVADIADLDSYYQFICDAFGNQFSITEIEFGLDSRDVMKTIYAVALTVIGQVSLATEMLLQDVDLANFIEKKNDYREDVTELYIQLEDLGYSQNQIDQMDIAYHMEKLGHRKQMSKDGKNKNQSNEPEYITFDQLADSVRF